MTDEKKEPARDNSEGASSETSIDSTVKELRSIVFILSGFQKKLALEGDVISTTTGEMTHSIKELKKLCDVLESLQPAILQKIAISIQKATQEASQTVSQEVKKHALQETESIVQKLIDSVEKAQNLIRVYQNESHFTKWKFFYLAILCGVFIGIATTYVLMPRLAMNDRDRTIYNIGETCSKFWDKLPKKTQDHLLDLAQSK